MNIGIISARYAKALLEYVDFQGNGDIVLEQIICIERAMGTIDELRQVIDDDTSVTSSAKIGILDSVLGGEMNPELRKFLNLVFSKGRGSCLKFIFQNFVDIYFRSRKIILGKLMTTVASPELESSLKKIVKDNTGFDLRIETEIVPDLIGGFIFTINDLRIDASIRRQLDTLKKQFIEKNRRIV